MYFFFLLRGSNERVECVKNNKKKKKFRQVFSVWKINLGLDQPVFFSLFAEMKENTNIYIISYFTISTAKHVNPVSRICSKVINKRSTKTLTIFSFSVSIARSKSDARLSTFLNRIMYRMKLRKFAGRL